MRISDWSSDVCSSDLGAFAGHLQHVFSHSLLSFPLLGRRRAAEAMRASRRGRGIGLADLLARLQSQYWPRKCARIGDDRADMAADLKIGQPFGDRLVALAFAISIGRAHV